MRLESALGTHPLGVIRNLDNDRHAVVVLDLNARQAPLSASPKPVVLLIGSWGTPFFWAMP